jgi:hypothetical protein
MSAIAVLAGALSVLLFFYVFIDAVWGRLEAGEAEIRVSRERSGTIVMPEVEVPDDWEPPPILPGDE